MSEVKRTGPPSPHERKTSNETTDKSAFKKLTKIEKTSEVDPELKKKKRGKASLGEEEEERLKSPFETLFQKSCKTDIFGRNEPPMKENLEKEYGSPTYSTVPSPSFIRQGNEEDNELPSSHEFLEGSSEKEKGGLKQTAEQPQKDDTKKSQEKPKELEQSKSKKTKKSDLTTTDSSQKKETKKESKKEAAFAVPEPKEMKEIKGKKAKSDKEKEKEKEEFHITSSQKAKEKVGKKRSFATKQEQKEEERVQQKRGSLQGLTKSLSPFTIIDDSKKKKKDEGVQIESEQKTPIPSHIATTAINHTARVMPYLSPDTHNLMMQMVSTILVMQAKDITTTQVILSSSAFKNSDFEGATITFTKYAAAPDSFNISLSGNTKAVDRFNENIASLQQAFDRGNFSFRVGRLEASYAPDRPLIRRKKQARDKGE
jgi:hypothetical protein